eukprot:6462943-Amphidinium_carterae.1
MHNKYLEYDSVADLRSSVLEESSDVSGVSYAVDLSCARHGRGGMQVVEDADTFLVEEATPETASQIVHKWLGFLKSSVLEVLPEVPQRLA